MMRSQWAIVLLLVALQSPGSWSVSITQYGAVAGINTVATAKANSASIVAAFAAAAAAVDASQRVVIVPPGQDYYVMNATIAPGTSNVVLQLEGKLVMSNNMSFWPHAASAALAFTLCRNITITGGGTIDGQGYDWWWRAILNPQGTYHVRSASTPPFARALMPPESRQVIVPK